MTARTCLLVSAVGLTLELVIAAMTVLPGAPLLPQAWEFLLIPGIFVVHFRSVRVMRREGASVRAVLRRTPPAASRALAALFVVCWAVGLASILHLAGQPSQIHGRYFLDDHGDLIAVSRSAYLHGLVLQQRIFTLIPAVFYALGVLINWSLLVDDRANDSPRTAPPPAWGASS